MGREEHAVILEFLSRGYSSSYTGESVAQAVGTTNFTLLELVPREGVALNLGQQVYIGPEERKEIKSVKGRLNYTQLTNTAQQELPRVIEAVIRASEPKYIEFFNKAGPISIRKHSLELLPSIGKKHAMALMEERDRAPFKDFSDMSARVNLLPDPVRVITERVIEELRTQDTKYFLFTVPPKREDERRVR